MLNQLRKIHRSTQTSRPGVSLIELIMVIAISSFMIAIALAGLNNSGRSRFDDGMRQVLNNLREVQNQAANGQAPPGGIGADQELFGKGIWFNPMPVSAYTQYYVFRPTTGFLSAFVADVAAANSTKSLPSGLKLTKIESTDSTDGAPISKGMIVFARGVSGGGLSGQTSSSALPFFFPRNRFVEAPGVVTTANTAATYNTPQNKEVTLTFTSSDGKYTSKIIINCATGTMGLTQ